MFECGSKWVLGSCLAGTLMISSGTANAASKKKVNPWALGVSLTWPDYGSFGADVAADGDSGAMTAMVPMRGQRFYFGHMEDQLQLMGGLGFDRDRIQGARAYPNVDGAEALEFDYDVVINALDLGAGFRYYLDRVRVGQVVPFLGAGAHYTFVWGEADFSRIDDLDDNDLEDAYMAEYERLFGSLDVWGGQLEGGATYFFSQGFGAGVLAGLRFDTGGYAYPKETWGDVVQPKERGRETITGLFAGLHLEARL
jgi:hypothetical protein